MPQLTHIVRFKVISVKCDVLQDGQQFTIYYRRGDTRRSTPCYAARSGVVDFSLMPEGAAIIHFKNGGTGRRFAPKYILFRLEEYTLGAPRRVVWETDVDCSRALDVNKNSGSTVIEVPMQIGGAIATMLVAILVYPENGLPLSFDTIPGLQEPKHTGESVDEVRVMSRGESMTLLISLETMLERNKQESNEVMPVPAPGNRQKLAELEEKRKNLLGVEGMAKKVIMTRCHDVVKAQLVTLARKFRHNYVGVTAAYFRQLALMSGASLVDSTSVQNEDTMRDQLERTVNRIENLKQQTHKLEQNQLALGQIQHKADVTAELIANLEKVDSMNGQIKILEQFKKSVEMALSSRDSSSTALGRDVKGANERIKALEVEQEQLRAQISHMVTTAVANVLSWARGKNPPQPEADDRATLDNFFGDPSADISGERQTGKATTAFRDPQPSAPDPSARSSSSSDRNSPAHFLGTESLPSMGDFVPGRENESTAKKTNSKAEIHNGNPLKPSGLDAKMFARPVSGQDASGSHNPPLVSDLKFVEEQDFGLSNASEHPWVSASAEIHAGGINYTDPYYDEMDYFTPPTDVASASGAATVELTEEFNFVDGVENSRVQEGATIGTDNLHASNESHPRPTLDFGSSAKADETATTSRDHVIELANPVYEFSASPADNVHEGDSTAQRAKYDLPTYNFGS